MFSQQHQKIYQHIHQTTPFGKRAKMPRYLDWFLQQINAGSVCDFGCGKGRLVSTLQKQYTIKVYGYDPGNPEFAASMDDLSVDLIISCDVLEHVEPEYLDETLVYLRQRSRYIYHAIALSPAKLILPDGRNAHLIQKPCHWWRRKFVDLGYKILKEDHTIVSKKSKIVKTPVLTEHYYIMAELET